MSIKSHHVLYLTIGMSMLFISVSTLQYWQKMLTLDTHRIKGTRTVGIAEQEKPASRKNPATTERVTTSALRNVPDEVPTSTPTMTGTTTTESVTILPVETTPTEPKPRETFPDEDIFFPTQSPNQQDFLGEPVISPGISKDTSHAEKDKLLSLHKGTELLDTLLPLSRGL